MKGDWMATDTTHLLIYDRERIVPFAVSVNHWEGKKKITMKKNHMQKYCVYIIGEERREDISVVIIPKRRQKKLWETWEQLTTDLVWANDFFIKLLNELYKDQITGWEDQQ